MRRYVMEPLLVARDALANAQLPVNVFGWMETGMSVSNFTPRTVEAGHGDCLIQLRNMNPDYQKWTLTNDHTLVPIRKIQLQARLDEIGQGDQLENWDSYGLELITPILRFDQKYAGFGKIGSYLSALKKDAKLDVLKSVWSTTHVHIGFDKETKDDFSWRFLQHVAFILLPMKT